MNHLNCIIKKIVESNKNKICKGKEKTKNWWFNTENSMGHFDLPKKNKICKRKEKTKGWWFNAENCNRLFDLIVWKELYKCKK